MVRCLPVMAAGLAIAAAAATPLRAAPPCLLCAGDDRLAAAPASGPRRSDEMPIEIDLSAGFNFRRAVLSGQTGDMIVDASRSPGGESALVGDYGLVGNVVITGRPNAAVHVALPRRVELVSRNGDRLVVDQLASTLPADPRLDANGRLEFSFGGMLALPAAANPGDYRAAISIDASYQ